MKKSLFLVALLCCVSFFANAQYGTLTINNNKPCTIHIIIHGTLSTSGCNGDYRSSIISIPGNTSVTYGDPTAVPGGMNQMGVPALGTADKFTMVRVYSSDPSGTCTLNVTNMSDCLAGSSTSVTGFTLEDAACSFCANADITWTGIGNDAIIDLN